MARIDRTIAEEYIDFYSSRIEYYERIIEELKREIEGAREYIEGYTRKLHHCQGKEE